MKDRDETKRKELTKESRKNLERKFVTMCFQFYAPRRMTDVRPFCDEN